MKDYFGTLWNLWLLTTVLSDKGMVYMREFCEGKTREVERIKSNNDNFLQFVYTHLSNLVQEPTHIIDNIFLGSAFNAANQESFQKYGIERVLNVTKEIPCVFPEDYEYYRINVRDTRDSFLHHHYEESLEFLKNEPSKKVLVHCYMGSSRSASVVIYYLMKVHKMGYQEALEFTQSKREAVNLNQNFADELIAMVDSNESSEPSQVNENTQVTQELVESPQVLPENEQTTAPSQVEA